MKKSILLLLGIGALFAASTACFGPSTKPIKGTTTPVPETPSR